MMRYIVFLLIVLCLPRTALGGPYTQALPLALKSITAASEVVPVFGTFELTLDITAEYDNPFDPAQMDVSALFTSPHGETMKVNGFFTRDFAWNTINGKTQLLPGAYAWKIRFTPDVPGAWRYQVTVVNREHTLQSEQKNFRVTPAAAHGFITRARHDAQRFAGSDGAPFIPVGLDMCWGKLEPGAAGYADWLPALHKAGGNWIRVWMWSWHCGLEWKADTRADGYRGAGVYNLENAWRLDALFDAATREGINIQLCLGTYGEFTAGGFFNEGQWKDNPYNAANGGPCAKPEDFWRNAAARALYQRRLRYLAARYGNRTNLFGWEFWNEANAPAAWVSEMAQYLKGTGAARQPPADPYRHLLTTSYGDEAVWKLPEIDYTQTHHYGMGDIMDHAPVAHADAQAYQRYDKPHLLAEFGIDWRKPDTDYDQAGLGVNFHNGLWSALLSNDAGTGMIWWWDNYVHPKGLYAQFTAVRRFADSVPWGDGAWSTLQADAPTAAGPESWSDLTLPATGGWAKVAGEATVTPAGPSGAAALLPNYFFSPNKPDLRAPFTFHVHYHQPGRFTVLVDTVSTPSTLRFSLDGTPLSDVRLDPNPPAAPGVKPDYESTSYKPEWKTYQATFNKSVGIDVPAGDHAITLDTASGDWISVRSYTMTNCHSSRYPALDIYGLTNGRCAILWAHNAAHNWRNVYDKKAIPTITAAATLLHGLPAGRYRVTWWDTMQGTPTGTSTVIATPQGLPLHFPDVPCDVAAIIQSGTGPPTG